jgi:hypothetical protein
MRPVTLEEVKHAVFSMPKNKSLGPDGFTSYFYQACWPIKEYIWTVVEDSWHHTNILPTLIVTFLSLILKEDKVQDPSKFQPITLCNVIFKIITRVISDRLKPLLPSLISLEKTNCVEGRQIIDGIILSHEVMHSLKTSKTPGMLLKLDFSKAFENLNWKYIQHKIFAFVFSSSWKKCVFSLTSFALFSILINGSTYLSFIPS